MKICMFYWHLIWENRGSVMVTKFALVQKVKHPLPLSIMQYILNHLKAPCNSEHEEHT